MLVCSMTSPCMCFWVNVPSSCHLIEIVHCLTFIACLYLKSLIFSRSNFAWFSTLTILRFVAQSLSLTLTLIHYPFVHFRTKFPIRSWFPIQFTWSSVKENRWKIEWKYCEITFVMTLYSLLYPSKMGKKFQSFPFVIFTIFFSRLTSLFTSRVTCFSPFIFSMDIEKTTRTTVKMDIQNTISFAFSYTIRRLSLSINKVIKWKGNDTAKNGKNFEKKNNKNCKAMVFVAASAHLQGEWEKNYRNSF